MYNTNLFVRNLDNAEFSFILYIMHVKKNESKNKYSTKLYIIFIMSFVNDSDSDNDSESDYDDIVYDPEEPSKTRFCIALCELFNDKIHGPGPNGHYLVHCRYKKLHMDWISETALFGNLEYQYIHNQTHEWYPNYRQIVLRPDYIKPELVECIYVLPDGHCVAIVKTFWLKIIQRAWKKVLKQRRLIQKSLSGLRQREMTGKWPDFPGLRGLLTR
jgi:hypothetical protein